ncbi:MAG TPA: sulfate permease [Hyphomicrobiales bacterium]|nr:sulfate permease [Hyphomicrobiales bacterium]
MNVQRLLPCLQWLREYRGATFASDFSAGLIVTIMLVPQSLAYALVAGLPPETGLYASILPLIAYAVFGTSRTLSVGPVAVASLMTAAAIGSQTLLPPLEAALWLALLCGAFLLLLGLLRLGFLANFLSHPVVSGFISASALLIALGQMRHLLGVAGGGDTLPTLLRSLGAEFGHSSGLTLLLGGLTLLFLLCTRHWLAALLRTAGLGAFAAGTITRVAPVAAVVITAWLAWYYRLDQHGVALLGAIPSGLPALTLPRFSSEAIGTLLPPAILIAVICYVESIAVARTLAARTRHKIDPDQELVALGACNVAAAMGGGFPVAGGFSRSAVSFDAGAMTPAAGLLAAIGMALATLYLGDALAWLPTATLAATIIVAVLPLVDLAMLRDTWRYSRSDFAAVALTITLTLFWGVELGVSCGVGVSLLLHLYKTSRPHIAEIGEVAGTRHFRNVARHQVVTHPAILALRVDESLYFANASYIEDSILQALRQREGIRHVVLMCSAVNAIDISALEVLEAINARLRQAQIGFHLSEVKGPVMDQLRRTDFLRHLNGRVFLSHHEAVSLLGGGQDRQ